MYNPGKIIAGLIVFVLFVTFPLWYNAAMGSGVDAPQLKKPVGENNCVESKEYMRASHMDLLNVWRDDVVRDGSRFTEGGKYLKSLSNGCLKCHENRKDFCKKCHDYAGVETFCWECHIAERESE